MATKETVISAQAIRFSELFLRGQFVVPWHQRNYDWKQSNVRALLEDIDEAVKEDRACYFLGAIMLVEVTSSRWEINDGQQRMVTLSLISSALCRVFARETTGSQREGIALRLLFDLEPGRTYTLAQADRYTPRITPPRNDSMRYRQMIRGNTIGTNGPLTAAWAEIENFFSPMDTELVCRYFDFLMERLEVACLWIPSRVDPNAVYETINCRGKRLDDLDLIRNFFYSYFNSEGEAERRISVHDSLDRIRSLFPPAKASDYMRCHLQCIFGFLRRDNFYRDVREAVRDQRGGTTRARRADGDYAFELTMRIAANEPLELFRVLTAATPDPDFIAKFEASARTTGACRALSVYLRELSSYRVAQPLIFALFKWYIEERDGRVRRRLAAIIDRNMSRLSTFVMRTAFVAPKFEPSHFETEFSNFAREIVNSRDIPDVTFAEFLRDCDKAEYGILDDSRFYEHVVSARLTGSARIKLFLLGVNGSLQRDARLLSERTCTVEHILPKSPQHWGNWKGFERVDAGDWTQRIGNLTLMGQSDNRPGPKYNGSFESKRQSYEASAVALTREVANYTEWTPSAIEARQREMATQAVRVWRFV